jgi:Xaa-Pro aminopeptidase
MKFIASFLLTLVVSLVSAQEYGSILPMKERARVINELLEDKIENYLPEMMRTADIDMWIVVSREYNEDPIIKTMLPAEWLAARRRTILVFYDNGKEVETLAVARYNVGSSFKSAWDKEKQPDQWERLSEIVAERNPRRIGINHSEHFGLTDGIVATDKVALEKALGKRFASRIVSAEPLALSWLETRTDKEMAIYPHIVRISHNIIKEAFSEKVITPGVTTTEDVVWWMRDKVRELGLQTWFHPTVDIQRADPERFDHLRTFSKRPDTQVIQPGDLLHCDFGITYLRLNTDQQQHAYVLRPGESEAPEFLTSALATGNRLQDIFTGNFKLNRTGNEVLSMSRASAISEGITPSIYTHPIGYHGHAAGTTLGMWDSQGGVPYTGDYPLHANTAYSIELNASVNIEEWGKDVRIMLEEEAFFDGESVRYIDGRQTRLILVNQP